MNNKSIVDKSFYWLDQKTRQQTTSLARSVSRRSFLSRLGMLLAGAASLPACIEGVLAGITTGSW